MKHRVFGRKLNRDIKQRKALFRQLINSLIDLGRIKTTVAKAKAIRGLAEKLVTKAKLQTNSAQIQLASFLNKKENINKLLKEIAPRFKDRMGGYIKIIRLGKRQGDQSEEVYIQWADYEEKKEKKAGDRKKDASQALSEKKAEERKKSREGKK